MGKQTELVERTIALLGRVHKWNWRNTDALARELRVDRQELLRALARHASCKQRKIRYHPFPSGRKLDILWGLVERVGEDPDLPPLRRADLPANEPPAELDPAIPWVFLSHSHRDAPWVLEIAELLKGAGAACWLYQLHIEFQETVIPTVREALRRCRCSIVCASRRSLGSLWVQKEFMFALDQLSKPVLVVLDGTDDALLEGFRPGLRPEQTQAKIGALAREAAAQLGVGDPPRWERIATEFAREVHDFRRRGGPLVVHPAPAPAYRGDFVHFDQILGIISWAAALGSGN